VPPAPRVATAADSRHRPAERPDRLLYPAL